jgi:glycosyltransferase involved in cell wall biosynthesis
MPPPLTVAFLLGNLTVGGSETKVVRLANRLAREGHNIHIIALGEPYTLRSMIEPDVRVECLDRKSRFSPSVLGRFRAYVEEHAIPVTVCINTYPLVYGWPVRMMLGRGRNVCIAAVNTSDHTTTRDRLFMILYAAILRRCDGLIFGSHGQATSWIRRYRLRNPRTTVIHNGVDTGHFHA